MTNPRTLGDTRTLYRLVSTARTINDILKLLDSATLDELDASIDFPTLGHDVPAVLIVAQWPVLKASWCEDLAATSKLPVTATKKECGALLVFGIDEAVYVLVYGEGHRLVPDHLKDQRFGLRFVARTIDPERVKIFSRRNPGRGGWSDLTYVAAGAPWWMLSMHAQLQVVRQLGGQAGSGCNLTSAGSGKRPVTLHGGAGLRARFGLDGADLIADVREVHRVLREQPPAPGLEIIDHVAPVTDIVTLARLDRELDSMLAEPATSAFVLTPPIEHQQTWSDGVRFRMRVGSAKSAALGDEPACERVLRCASLQVAGKRVAALKRGEIEVFADWQARDRLVRLSPYACLEVGVTINCRRFFLLEGHWYEVDATYLEARRARVRGLFKPNPSLDLPAWNRERHAEEKDYNEAVPGERPGYVVLDRKFIPNPLRSDGELEICDLLAPDNTLIAVKRASRNESLSHLFWQGINAVQALLGYAKVRQDFAELVARHGRGRTIPPDFTPKKLAFAILDNHDRQVLPDTLTPFALLALAEAADQLNSRGIDVEVISVSPDDKQP